MADLDRKYQAQKGIVNTIMRTVEKTVSQGNFTKTILATVQYCIDKVNGQYKIKYQNGYLTAYAQNTSDGYIYSEGALVYVLVPNGDLTSRLLIVGSASNNNGDKIYLTNLSDDQKYKKIGSNLLVTNGPLDLNLSSYWCEEGPEGEFIKYYYQEDQQNGMFIINETAIDNIKRSKYFRLGATFKTSFTDDRKVSGDYGIKLVAVFKKDDGTLEEKEYVLNTFIMNGTPFEFTDPVPQYAFWELTNPDKLLYIKSVGGFVCNFPVSEREDPPIDIQITDLSIFAVEKLYDVTEDVHRVQIDSPIANFTFQENDSVDLMARFHIRDIGEVQGDLVNDLEFYWAKKDCQVNSTAHPRYSSAFGDGWYCLNPCTVKKSDETDISILRDNSINTIKPDDPITYKRSDLTYYVNVPTISLPVTLCKGKETIIKCAVKYNDNFYYSDERIIYNGNGYYVLVGAMDGKKKSQNGDGYFTIGAGIFKDVEEQSVPDNSKTLDASHVSYSWTQIQNGVRKKVPPTNRSDIAALLFSYGDPPDGWDSSQDNETIAYSNPEDNQYLHDHPKFILCAERYKYYNSRKNSDELSTTEKNRCKTRSKKIITDKQEQIQSYYVANYENQLGYYITGPSVVTAEYLAGGQREAINAVVNSVTPQFDSQVDVQNTLYQIPAYVVSTVMTYEVSAIVDGYDIGTAEITLVNEAGNAFEYSIDITNGLQTYMYDERGLSPCAEGATQPISISPLTFVLYNKEGEKLYDSAAPTLYPDIDIGQLKPIWRFADANYSLLCTNYQKPDGAEEVQGGKYATKAKNFDTTYIWELRNEAQFYYTLQDNYNPNSISYSNIELELIYDGQSVFGTTSFTFAKQGELGTNGTNRALTIYSPPYTNNYKEQVLSDSKYCNFNPRKTPNREIDKYMDTAVRHFGPDARHVGNPYMFATNSYNSLADGAAPCSRDEGRYVNLYLAQGPGSDGREIAQSSMASYQAMWNNRPNEAASNNDNWQWSIDEAPDIKEGSNVYHYRNLIRPSGSTTSAEATFAVVRKDDHPVLSERPLYEVGNNKYYPNNIIRVSASTTTSDNNTVKNYAFCTVPYYYFNWTHNLQTGTYSPMPEGVDPARHIVIIGGFDQVMYDSTGHNPSYNSQNPFQFYIFNESGHDITYEVIKSALAGNQNTTIEWNVSPGLNIKYRGDDAIHRIRDFDAIDKAVKKGALCSKMVNDVKHYYKCIKQHDKDAENKVRNGDDSYVTYPPGAFVPPYWTEIDPISYSQTMEVVPASTFESIYEANLFNSWVHLKVTFDKYEAEAIIPINIYCNSYESPELNAWDGKSVVMEDGDDQSYLIANKVSAGVKDNENRFVGISIGENIRYVPVNTTDNSPSKKVSSVGLFGFGQGPNGVGKTKQTLFLDAKTGLAAFGASGASQIVLNPNPEKWSRLAGWYFSKDYLYKPVGGNGTIEESSSYKNIMNGEDIEPPRTGVTKSFGIYVPSNGAVNDRTIAIWAGDGVLQGIDKTPPIPSREIPQDDDPLNPKTKKFWVTYGGLLHAENADISGTITAESGGFGTTSEKVSINKTINDHHYVIHHKDFWVETESTSTETGDQGKKTTVGIRGNIMAESGQIGSTRSNLDGLSKNAIFLYYQWYDWHYPADNEPFRGPDENNPTYYLDNGTGKTKNTTYLLYHPNFSVERDGETRINGKIYTKQGRIGGWVIKENDLRSYTYDASTHTGAKLDCYGNANFGNLDINSDGSIGTSDHTWWITAAGVASFTDGANSFRGKEFYLGSSGTVGIGKDGLHLDDNQKLTIGTDNDCYLEALGEGGFTFGGSGKVWFSGMNLGLDQGAAIDIGNGSLSFGGGLVADNTGLHTTGLGTFSINASGNTTLKTLNVGGTTINDVGILTVGNDTQLMIGSKTLKTYIEDIINGMSIAVTGTASVLQESGNTVTVLTSVTLA